MEITPILEAVVDVTTQGDGGHVRIDPIGTMLMAALYLLMVLVPFVLTLLLNFYKKKLQHMQILAAMDKGLPIADLIEKPNNKEVNWVRSISAGIGYLFVGLALSSIWVWISKSEDVPVVWLIIPILISGLGLVFFFRGVLQKNYEKLQKKERDIPAQ
jgi:hypothetical protein